MSMLETMAIRFARPIEVLLGLYFLVAAFLKAEDINLFFGQIRSYQLFTGPWTILTIAVSALMVETFLGMAMVAGLRWRHAVHAAVQAIMVFFTVLIAYAWLVHGITDCGCFGKHAVTPPMGIAKNIVTMLLDALAWYGLARGARPGTAWRAGAVSAALGVTAVVYALATNPIQMPKTARADPAPAGEGEAPATAAPSGPFAPYSAVLLDSGEMADVTQGEYLVVVVSMTCDHCKESIPGLNAIAAHPGLPRLIGFGWEPAPGDFDVFKLETSPQFPLYNMGQASLPFFELIGQDPPRLWWVKDGQAKHHWDWPEGEMPPAGETIAGLVASG